MDIQNNNVTIQINAKDLSGKQLRVADCDVFIVHVFTDNPKNYLTFSKRDMLMTEFVDELTIPGHQMSYLCSGVVQFTYHYLPQAHDCEHDTCFCSPEFSETDDVEMSGVYHPERPAHGHRHEQLIHSKPVVTSIYWRNIKHPHPDRPLNSVTLIDLERVHRLIENEHVARETEIAQLKSEYGEKFTDKIDAEIERSTAEDERINAEIAEIKETIGAKSDEDKEAADKVNSEIAQNHADITAETARATAKEIELEQMIQGEVARAKAIEEVIDTKIVMEKERAQSNESNINDRVVSVTDRFDAFKALANERIDSVNDRVSGLSRDLAAEVSRAADKDIEHTNLVVTEANRAAAVENRLEENLNTEVTRAKDAESHILDEVHALRDNVASLATATNVYNKAEVDTKISAVNDNIASVQNWIDNHTDNTDELKAKVAVISADLDKAKTDILTEIADRANADTTLQTAIDVVTGKVDAEIERAKATETAINEEIATLKATITEKATTNADATAEVAADLVKETARATAAEKVLTDAIDVINGDNATNGSIKKALADAKDYTDAEIAKNNLAKATELNDTLSVYAKKTDVDAAIQNVIGTAPEALDTLGKISDALSADTDAISAINGVLSGKANSDDVYTKSEVDSKFVEVDNSLATLETKVDNTDAAISSRIDDLSAKVVADASTAAAAQTALSDAIAAEEIARKAADTATNDKFDAKVDELNTKISDVNAALIADIAKSDAKDIELEALISANAAAIATESARAKQVETELNDKINNLDVAGTNTAIAGLDAKIIAEEAARTAADSVIETAINNEVVRAEAAEKALSDKLDILNGDAETVGSLAHAVHDANHYTDDEIAKYVNTLDLYKLEADAKFAQKSDVYSKNEIDAIIEVANNKINAKLPIDSFNEWSESVATKTYVDEKVADIVADSSKINEIETGLAAEIARATAAEQEIYNSIENVSDTLEAAIKELEDMFDSSTGGEGENAVITRADLDEALDDFYTKDDVNDLIVSNSAEILSGVYSKEVSDEKYQPKGNYCTPTQAEAAAAVKANDVKLEMESRIATLEAINHDAYLTQHQSLENYYTKAEAQNTFLRAVQMTAAEYDALTNKDENVLYIITA